MIRPRGLQSQLGFYLRRSLEALCRAPKIPINAIRGIVILFLSVEDANLFARCGWADLAF